MKQESEKYQKARELSAKIAHMSDDERAKLSEQMVSVFNPQGHQLTMHNTMLLMMQCQRDDLTLVAGFKQWMKAGRAVRKGERSIGFIQVPIHKKAKEGENKKSDRPYFKLVSVFDVSQTGELGDKPAKEEPTAKVDAPPPKSEKISGVKVDPAVVDALKSGAWGDDGIFRIEGQLDRKLYVAVNKALEAIGGKWNRGKKGHVFDNEDARANLDDVIHTGAYIDWKKTNEFFETPPDIAGYLLDCAKVGADTKMLEPSAGSGAIVLPALERGAYVTAIEKHSPYADKMNLNGHAVNLQIGDFLAYKPMGIYDAVTMNPPFRSDMEHVRHAYEFVKPGGYLVSVMSPAWTFRTTKKAVAFREWLEDEAAYLWEDLPSGTFQSSGTMVNCGILTLSKPEEDAQ